MDDRASSAAGMSSLLAQVQAACATACQPAGQHLQAALAVLAKEEQREPQAAALAAALQGVAGLLRGLPPADSDLPGCVGGLGSAVSQLAAGYAHVLAMLHERHKVGVTHLPVAVKEPGGHARLRC
jgi:hypothetical protein